MNPIRQIRRFATVLAGLAAAVLLATPAFARVEPDPGAGYVAPASVPAQVQVHTIVAGGMPGWQIALIATRAALAAATVAVLLDRGWAARCRSPLLEAYARRTEETVPGLPEPRGTTPAIPTSSSSTHPPPWAC